MLSIREKERTGVGPMIGAHHPFVRTVDVHDPYLVASVPATVRLKDEFPAVWAEVGLAVVAVKGALRDVPHVTVFKPCVRLRIGPMPGATAQEKDCRQNDRNGACHRPALL
jgi:hypothetical protein